MGLGSLDSDLRRGFLGAIQRQSPKERSQGTRSGYGVKTVWSGLGFLHRLCCSAFSVEGTTLSDQGPSSWLRGEVTGPCCCTVFKVGGLDQGTESGMEVCARS